METTPAAQADPSSPGLLLAADWLLDTLPWAVLVLDEAHIVRRINQQAARWCSAPPAALLGRPLAGAGLPSAVEATLLRMLAPGEAAPHEVWLPQQERWITFSATRQPGGWVLYGQDITPQKQSQAEALHLRDELMQHTADKYHALFYGMDQGFCVLEALFDATGQQAVDFRYLELNPVFEQQSGMPAGAQGKTMRELLPDLEPFWFDTYGRVVRTGETVRVEHHVPSLARWFDVHAFRVGRPEAQQIAVLFGDITARKQVEAALAAAFCAPSWA